MTCVKFVCEDVIFKDDLGDGPHSYLALVRASDGILKVNVDIKEALLLNGKYILHFGDPLSIGHTIAVATCDGVADVCDPRRSHVYQSLVESI